MINSYKGSEIPKLINVQFQSYQTNKYVVKAYIKAKTIHVNYDANNGTGVPQATTVKSIEKITVDSTTRPTRVGYIFTGWTYGGKLYQGGESFDAPTSDVTFVAQWVKASEVINYTVNDSKMGSVSRSYERIGETVQGIVQGSTAIAKTGYRFVKWVKDTNPNGDAVSTEVEYKPTTEGTYMAVFEAVKSDLVVRYVEDTHGEEISETETTRYEYGKSYTVTAKDIKGYRLISESPITGTKGVSREEIVFTYTQKKGKVVYNLGPNGSWGNGSPENVVEFDTAKGKWAYNYGFDNGDTFVVTDKVPTSSDNAVFVGWYDKKRDTTSATMRKAGETVTYPYTEASNTNTYTLDALWEKLQGTSKELPYDGTAHSLDEFTVKFANENLQGWTDSASSLVQASNIQYGLKQDGREVNEWGAMPSFKDAGTYTIEAKATVNNVELRAEATLTITPKSVTVTADNKSKVFGEADPKLTAKVDGTLGDDTVEYALTREEGEAVGEYAITASGKAEQGNYSVTYVAGTLTITSKVIDKDGKNVEVNSPTDHEYDSKAHKWSPTVTDTKTGKELVADTDYTVVYSTENFKDVGTIDVTITGKGNYTGTVTRTYRITPKEYTVTTDSATKTYSATALTAGGKVEGIVSGETVEFTTTGSQTEVGTSKNTYELVWKSAKATNYTLANESIGELTVKAKSIVPDGPNTPDEKKTGITVSEPSDSKYDGKEHREVLTVTDTKTGKELVAGTDYSVTYSSDLVNAGTVTIKVAGLGNYTGSFTKTYKITKRSVTLTSATVSKVYDGSALTNTDIAVSGDGFVEGEGASYEVTGSQTEIGNSANAFEYKLNEKTLASNYNITKVVGTLTITAAPAPVTPATPSTPSTPSSTTSTTPRTLSAPQVTTPAETFEKETTPKAEPKKEEKVEEEYTPKASPQYYWALINLICAILTVLFGLLLLISKRHKDEDDDEEDDDETKQQTNNDDEEKEQEKKRGLFTRVLAVLIAIVSVVFFLVTEDLSLPWTWTDQWTIWMVVIGLVQIVVFFVGRKWKNVDNDDEDEEAQQA